MKALVTSLKVLFFFSLLTGAVYPLVVTGVSRILFPHQAGGSLLTNGDKIVGSELIAQEFKDPKYFWPRPSAAGYNPLPSGGSNLGPISQDLLSKFNERKAQGFTHEMLFASASGLDPDISPEAARDQVSRIAQARGIAEEQILKLVNGSVVERQLGFLGEPRVNVLAINLKLDEMK